MENPFVVPAQADSVCQPPSSLEFFVDRAFRALARIGVILILALVVALVIEIGRKAIPGIQKYGIDMLIGTVWDVNQHKFGILPAILVTLYSLSLIHI